MTEESWQDRLRVERDTLSMRLDKLESFIDTGAFGSLPLVDQGDLYHQRTAMAEYLHMLNRRIRRTEGGPQPHSAHTKHAMPDEYGMVEALLMQYSEWLDTERIVRYAWLGDERTHEQLVREFLAARSPQARPRLSDGERP